MQLDQDPDDALAGERIPILSVIDAPGQPDPLDLPMLHAGATEILLEAAGIHGPMIGRLDRISRNWLVRSGSPHLQELDAIAARMRHSGVYLLNLSYEWSCTMSIIADADGRVRMRRTFDWGLRALARTLTAFYRRRGRYPYLSLSWPMFVGEATIVAPNRFAIAMNQAPLRLQRLLGLPLPEAVAIWTERWAVNLRRALPPAHLLRQIAEEASSASEAIDRLMRTPTSKQAIFCVAGLSLGDSAVIEKDIHEARLYAAPAVAANHWRDAPPRFDPQCSLPRAEAMAGMPARAGIADWCIPPILSDRMRFAADICLQEGIVDVVAALDSRLVTPITRFSIDN